MRLPYQPDEIQQVQNMLRLKAATPGLPASRLAELMRLERTRDAQGAEARRELGTLKGYADESAGVYDEMAQETRDVDSYKVPERKGPSKGQQLFGIGLGLLGAATGHRDPASLTGQAIGGAKERADQEYADEMAALDRRIATNKEAKMAKIAALQARLGGIGQRADVAKLGLGLASDEATRAGGDAMRLQGDIQQQENWERQFANANNQWRQEFGAQESAQRFHELPEAAKALQNVPYLIQSGMSPEDANRAVFSEWIIGNAQAKWMPQTLEQQFGMTKIAADSATEELSQLKTKGRYLEPMLKQESAASALSMANTRQIMSERAEQIKAIKDGRVSGDLTELGKLQLQDALGQVKGYEELITKYNEDWTVNSRKNDDASQKAAESARQMVALYQQQRNKAKAAVKALAPGFYGQ